MTDRTQNDAREASFSERIRQLSEGHAISGIFAVLGGTNGQSVGRRSHAEGNSLKSRVHSSKQDHDALSDRPYGTSSPRASNVPLVP